MLSMEKEYALLKIPSTRYVATENTSASPVFVETAIQVFDPPYKQFKATFEYKNDAIEWVVYKI